MMQFSQTDISDYVSGRLDDLDRARIDTALPCDFMLRRAIEQARRIDRSVKARLELDRPGQCFC